MWTCPPSSPFPSRVSVRCPNGVWLPAPPQTSPSPNISALCLGQITALCPAAPSSVALWDAELHPHPSASSSICILIHLHPHPLQERGEGSPASAPHPGNSSGLLPASSSKLLFIQVRRIYRGGNALDSPSRLNATRN